MLRCILPGLTIHHGSILDITCDALVSPANSFGFMDGGVGALYLRRFGKNLQQRVQQTIAEHRHGELLVGAADVVETGDPAIPFLIVAPAMRAPMTLTDSVNPYLAARAVLLLTQHGRFRGGQHQGVPIRDLIKTVAIPGLGTGVGDIGPYTCAHQVRAAIEQVWLGLPTAPRTWAEASERHHLLDTRHPRRLQEPPS